VTLDPATLVPLLGLLLLTGAVAGLLAGLLGVGGGIVIVPVLFWGLGALGFPVETRMTIAVATSLATIIPTSIASARSHHRKENVDMGLVRGWGPFVVGGALAGGLLSFVLDGDDLTLVFGAVALAVALNMAVPRTLTISGRLPEGPLTQGSIAGGIGLFSALMGIGGGSLTVPALSLFRVPTHRAVGTAAAFGLLIAVPGAVGFVASGWGAAARPPLSLGWVNLPAAAVITSATVFTAPLGARLAARLPAGRLRLAFAVFLGVTAARMLWTALG
jgi:uncharacterized membrane protein YfcA